MTSDAEPYSAASTSRSCRSDFKVSLSRRDCLRCRRSPEIRRTVRDLASASAACSASASWISAARLVPGFSLTGASLTSVDLVGTWPLVSTVLAECRPLVSTDFAGSRPLRRTDSFRISSAFRSGSGPDQHD